MEQGRSLSVPDDFEQLLELLPLDSRPVREEQVVEVKAAMADPRGLRQALYLSVLISPLLAILTGRELQKYSACVEEILVVSPTFFAVFGSLTSSFASPRTQSGLGTTSLRPFKS